jgi:hypothetical protein
VCTLSGKIFPAEDLTRASCLREEILLFPNVLVFPLKRQLFTCTEVPVLMGSLQVNERP